MEIQTPSTSLLELLSLTCPWKGYKDNKKVNIFFLYFSLLKSTPALIATMVLSFYWIRENEPWKKDKMSQFRMKFRTYLVLGSQKSQECRFLRNQTQKFPLTKSFWAHFLTLNQPQDCLQSKKLHTFDFPKSTICSKQTISTNFDLFS